MAGEMNAERECGRKGGVCTVEGEDELRVIAQLAVVDVPDLQ
jgi:hypothetical protein